MALVLKDRVKESSNTTGTGTFSLGGAYSGFQSFSVIGNSNTTYYAIVNLSAAEWEVGIGTYTASGATLSRDTILESSNSGSAVNFSAGTKDVFCTYPAEKAVTLDDVQTLSNKTIASPSVSGNLTFTGTGNRITGDFSNATVANRVLIQTSAPSSNTRLGMLPTAATGGTVGPVMYSTPDTANCSFFDIRITDGVQSALISEKTGTGTYLPITLQTGGSERMRVDTSGNVGIGTSSPNSGLQLKQTSNGGDIAARIQNSSTTAGSTASLYFTTTTNDAFNSAFLGSDRNNALILGANAAERMRIDSSGNVGIGTSSPQTKLQVSSTTTTASGSAAWENTGATLNLFYTGASATDAGSSVNFSSLGVIKGAKEATDGNGYLSFMTRNGGAGQYATERMRIDSSGNLLVGTTDAGTGSGPGIKLLPSTTTPNVGTVFNTSAGNYNCFMLYNTNATFNGYRFYVATNGGIFNYSGNNTNLSDERTKTNIELSGSYLDKICAIPVKLFNYKDEPEGEQRTLGVIAQDVELVAPELVNNDGIGEVPEGDLPLKSVYTTDMMFALMKCIQEQQAMITQLQADVAALKGN
jgi:hypothetical protein